MNLQNNLKKIAAVAIPKMNGSDWNFLQTLRRAYDIKGYNFIEPHFTLLSLNKQFSKQVLSKTLRSNLNQMKKIHFSIHTAIFMPPLNGHKSWYVFLIPDRRFIEFIELRYHLSVTKLHEDEKLPFIPHITVGSFHCKADCLRLVNEINATTFELSGDIEKISLIEEHESSAQIFDQIVLQE